MSTSTSYDHALDFRPTVKRKRGRPQLFSTLRTVLAAMSEGLEAARRYQELTGRGVPHAEAAKMVFADHYAVR